MSIRCAISSFTHNIVTFAYQARTHAPQMLETTEDFAGARLKLKMKNSFSEQQISRVWTTRFLACLYFNENALLQLCKSLNNNGKQGRKYRFDIFVEK